MKHKNMKELVLPLLLWCSVLTPCIGKGASDVKTSNAGMPSKTGSYPVTISNYGHELVFEKEPRKVIALDLNAATSLTALGVEDDIIATRTAGIDINAVNATYREKVKKLPIPDEMAKLQIPSLETLLALEPDLIVMDSFYFNVPNIFGSYEDYEKNGIKIYVTEGTQIPNPTIENSFNDLMNLGKIFGAEARAKTVTQELRKKVTDIQEQLAHTKPVKVVGYDSGQEAPYVAGGLGLENALIEAAHGENVFKEIKKQFSRVSFEQMIQKNPDYIILHGTPVDPRAEKLIAFLNTNKALADVTAVKEKRYIVVPLSYIFSGIHNVDGFEIIAKGLHPEVFGKQ
ncbi:MAG: ABC transporter substrate-binding protein [Treponema sp.]